MFNSYYSIRMYIAEYPLVINCQDLLEMADAISNLLGCKYDYLGYTLLDPDYNYKDLGVMLKNTEKNRKKFLKLSIPTTYKGKKDDWLAAPFVRFEAKGKNDYQYPFYELRFDYSSSKSQYLCISIDIKERLLAKEITLKDFNKVLDIVNSKGYVIQSSFLDYYVGNSKRVNFDSGESAFDTANDYRILDHSVKFREEWKNKIMDVFYMNTFDKKLVSSDAIEKIAKIVGKENLIWHEQKFIFKLPESKTSYLLNRILTVKSRRKIKGILQREKVCFKDVSIIAAILKL